MGVFKLSLVVPVFNEEDNLHLFLDRCRTVLIEMGVDYEFIFIDDGSTDGSLALLTEAATADDRVKVLSLSRNFGSHASISAGLDHASGDAAVILAADLQDPPEVIPQFLSPPPGRLSGRLGGAQVPAGGGGPPGGQPAVLRSG